MTSRPGKRKIFILRIWPHGRDELEWVGEIQEVSTGETVYVHSLEDLFAWLRQKTAQALEVPIGNDQGITGIQK